MKTKQDVILRGLIWNGEVSLAVADTTRLVGRAIEIHGLSPLSAAALGRTLTVAAYMCSSLKEERGALSVSVKGDGIGGPIYVSGDKKLRMRGYIDNPQAFLPPNARGKLDVGGCVGRNGTLSVVREDGEGIPFVGTTPLVSGEIGEDFAAYFAYSEQLPTAIAVGVKIDLPRRGRRIFAAASRRVRREPEKDGRNDRKVCRGQQHAGRDDGGGTGGKIFRQCQFLQTKTRI